MKTLDVDKGIVAVLGLPDGDPEFVMDLAKSSEFTIYFQSQEAADVRAVRQAAEQGGLLGDRVFVDAGSLKSVPLADNVADGILVAPAAEQQIAETELLRALRPRAVAFVGDRQTREARPRGDR